MIALGLKSAAFTPFNNVRFALFRNICDSKNLISKKAALEKP
jgi:hypothetical protein